VCRIAGFPVFLSKKRGSAICKKKRERKKLNVVASLFDKRRMEKTNITPSDEFDYEPIKRVEKKL
jgi:hypothetical protein